MIEFLFVVPILILGVEIYQFWPIRGLAAVDFCEWQTISRSEQTAKMIDVNDATDFMKAHKPGAINISVGRLPFVWQHSLSPDDCVLIVANGRRKRLKAARILRRRGFLYLYTFKANPRCECVSH